MKDFNFDSFALDAGADIEKASAILHSVIGTYFGDSQKEVEKSTLKQYTLIQDHDTIQTMLYVVSDYLYNVKIALDFSQDVDSDAACGFKRWCNELMSGYRTEKN